MITHKTSKIEVVPGKGSDVERARFARQVSERRGSLALGSSTLATASEPPTHPGP